MSLPRSFARLISRARTLSRASRVGLALAAVAFVAAVPALGWARHAWSSGAVLTSAGDTTVVYGPKQIATPTGAATTVVERFTVPATTTGQFLLRVSNGAASGAQRVAAGSIRLNGAEVMTSAELVAIATGGVATKPVLLLPTDTLVAIVEGGAGAYVTLSVLAAPDPTFAVFGPKTYERGRGVPAPVLERFTLPPGGGAPFRLCVQNGLADGTRRNSSAWIRINGVEVVREAELNMQVAGFIKEVTLKAGENVMEVQLNGAPGSRLTLCAVATDVAAPRIRIAAPVPQLITRERKLDVTGVVLDETPVGVTVNGTTATVEANSPGETSFQAAAVALAVEGENRLTVTAIDAAGNRTDSTRTVIRDTEPPVVTITSLGESSVVADSTILVKGTVTDRTQTTANMNGTVLTLAPTTGAFEQSVRLAAGTNFVSITATDAAGNATTVVRQVTRDDTPPTLTLTAPTEGLITKEPATPVTGSAVALSAVSVTVNGTPATVGSGGAFTGTLPLTEGNNALTVVATNAAGLSATATRTVIHDATPPAISWTAPADGLLTKESAVAVTGTITDATTVTATFNGAALALNAQGAFTTTLPLTQDGPVTLTIVATDAAGNRSTQNRKITRDATPPLITVHAPEIGLVTKAGTVVVSGSVVDKSMSTLKVNGSPMTLSADGGFLGSVAIGAGVNTITFAATDSAGNAAETSVVVTRDSDAPAITITAPADGSTTPNADVTVTGTVTDASPVTATLNGTALTLGTNGAFSAPLALTVGANTITVVATDSLGNAGSATRSVTRTAPPPPQDIPIPAPALNRTLATTAAEAMSFLYQGPNAVQTGVAAGTISAMRIAAIRGRVLSKDLMPLTGVEVSIRNRPELGKTVTRADGGYVIVVNGGGVETLDFGKTGYIPAQRSATLPWQDWAYVDDVILLQPDANANPVTLGAGVTTTQVARGSVSTDSSGTRQATVLIDAGTAGIIKLPDGTTQPLTSATIRLTEFTVGPNGPNAMPASLPEASAYTYAFQVTADGVPAGATVELSKPAAIYVDNFLNFPVGTVIPNGEYDPTRAAWVPQPNGITLSILSIIGGVAMIDITGDAVAEADSTLDRLGVDLAERRYLAQLYTPPVQVWRATLNRFARAGDLNGPGRVPSWAERPKFKPQPTCGQPGSDVLRCEVQTASQHVGIAGTPYTLSYRSDRTSGRATRSITIALTGDTIPRGLRAIEAQLIIGGRAMRVRKAPAAQLSHTFLWDGKDAFGRPMQGRQKGQLQVTMLYPSEFMNPSANWEQAFGLTCTGDANNPTNPRACFFPGDRVIPGRTEAGLSANYEVALGGFDASAQSLGGFTLSSQHSYDPMGRTLYYGDGRSRNTSDLNGSIKTIAGKAYAFGTGGRYGGDGGPALEAYFNFQPTLEPRVAVGHDGSVYVLDHGNFRVRKVSREGIVTTVAGTGTEGYSGDGGPATSAQLRSALALAVGPDGALYIGGDYHVRRVDLRTGIISTYVAVPPAFGTIYFGIPIDLAFAKDGTLYIAGRNSVLRVAPGAKAVHPIFNLAQTDVLSPAAQVGVPSGQTWVYLRYGGMAVAPDGSLYVADASNLPSIKRVGLDGIVTLVAGGNQAPADGSNGDGKVATSAYLMGVNGLAFDREGNLLVSERPNYGSIRRIDATTGIITTVAGGVKVAPSPAPDGGPPRTVAFHSPGGAVFGPEGNLYFAERFTGRVRKVTLALPGFTGGEIAIASEDGRELFAFDSAGRHLRTVDALTRDTLHLFAYDAAGRLVSVTDADKRVMRIERDASGNPVAIVAPDGHRTVFTLTADGYLATITGPDGQPTRFGYGSGGLLTSATDRNGKTVGYSYDPSGALASETRPNGGSLVLSVVPMPTGSRGTISSGTGVRSETTSEILPSGAKVTTTRSSDGFATQITEETDGRSTIRHPDGTLVSTSARANQRSGMESPIEDVTLRLPSGLTLTRRVGMGRTFDEIGMPATDTDTLYVNGRASIMHYDHASQLGFLATPGGRRHNIQLDGNGRVTRDSISGFLATTYRYDAAGRMLEAIQGDRRISQAFDARGRLASRTDALGQTERFVYNDADLVVASINTRGDTTRTSRDGVGNRVAVTPPGRGTYRFGFTPTGMPSAYVFPDVGTGVDSVRAEYDVDNRPVRLIRAAGDTVTITHDAFGRKAARRTIEGITTFSYDSTNGNLRSIAAPGGITFTQAFDGVLLTRSSWSGAITGAVSFEYNNDLRVTRQRVNDGHDVSFAYDADGLPAAAGALTVTRTPGSFMVSGTTLGAIATAHSYDGYAGLLRSTATYSGASLYDARYKRDAIGRIVELTETVAGETLISAFAYDSAQRLSSVTRNGVAAESFEYDVNGNRRRHTTAAGVTTGAADARDRLTAYGSSSFRYAKDGQRSLAVSGADTTAYQFAALGWLKGVRLPDGRQVDYVLDGEGRRIGKKMVLREFPGN